MICQLYEQIKLKDLVKLSRLPIDLIKKILKDFAFLFESPETRSEFVRIKKNSRVQLEIYCKRNGISSDTMNLYKWIPTNTMGVQLHQDLKGFLKAPFNAKRSLDQFLVNIDTLVRRAQVLTNEIQLPHPKIVFLGDDDCTSVALAQWLKLNKNNNKNNDNANTGVLQDWEITVIDIDQELLNYIQSIASRYDLPIQLYQQDFLKPIGPTIAHLLNTQDIIFTDPPYTENGMGLFLLTALQLLKYPVGKIFACFGYSIQEHTMGIKIQNLFNRMGLYIEKVYENFNIYEGAFSIGATSSLFTLQPLKKWEQIENNATDGPIYTGDNTKESQEIIRS